MRLIFSLSLSLSLSLSFSLVMLDRIIYYIVGSVVVGVLLVVIVIVVIAVFAYGKQRYNQRKKTLSKDSLTGIN